MKLFKKLMSAMLAGVLAVGMLAGWPCAYQSPPGRPGRAGCI